MKCSTPRCRKKPRKNRKKCDKCYMQQWRQDNPEKASYNNLKSNAIRRGKPFTITFEYFLQFCYEFDYMKKKGRLKHQLTVDCKINELGYVPENIQGMTKSENSRKGVKVLVFDYQNPKATKYTNGKSKQQEADDYF